MPRGGHMGAWFPLPKDFFRSRWKSFYKRSWRQRTPFNAADRLGPHRAGRFNPDDVPSHWKLQYSAANYDESIPKALYLGREAGFLYKKNLGKYLEPGNSIGVLDELNPTSIARRDAIFRCLDRGRRGGYNSCIGRLESTPHHDIAGAIKHVPHLTKVMFEHIQPDSREDDFFKSNQSEEAQKEFEYFHVKRLQDLCEEYEIVWRDGRRPERDSATEVRRQKQVESQGTGLDRGHFPYVDEQASLVDELALRDILKLRHKTNKRRHPYWAEYTYQNKKKHQQYLRRRQMNIDAAKSRLGLQVNQ